jgi:hypothetical protein
MVWSFGCNKSRKKKDFDNYEFNIQEKICYSTAEAYFLVMQVRRPFRLHYFKPISLGNS